MVCICKICSAKLAAITDECNTLTAQRDHYRARCDELAKELESAQKQLNSSVNLSQFSTNNTSLFDTESIQRLQEWQECIKFCIEEREGRLEGTNPKGSRLEDTSIKGREGEKDEEKDRKGDNLRSRGKNMGAVLPFSQVNLAGFLTKNHRLTQRYTEYPEPKQKQQNTSDICFAHFYSDTRE